MAVGGPVERLSGEAVAVLVGQVIAPHRAGRAAAVGAAAAAAAAATSSSSAATAAFCAVRSAAGAGAVAGPAGGFAGPQVHRHGDDDDDLSLWPNFTSWEGSDSSRSLVSLLLPFPPLLPFPSNQHFGAAGSSAAVVFRPSIFLSCFLLILLSPCSTTFRVSAMPSD